MDQSSNFDVNESLKQYLSDPATIPTPEADSELLDCENDPEQLTPALVDEVLNRIIDSVTIRPESICHNATIDSLQFLLKQSSTTTAKCLGKILDLVVSGLSAEADSINGLELDDVEVVRQHKQLLEIYGFLLQWTVASAETKMSEKGSATQAVASRGKGAKVGKTKVAGTWDFSPQIQMALDVMSKVLKIKIGRIFQTTSERDTFISLFTRAVYLIQESETRMKSTALRMHTYKVLCIAIKHHGHAYGAQTCIIQSLTYFEHLAEPMAEMLHILAEQYDHTQLTEEVLRELSTKEFNSNDLRGPKSVSTFIAKLSELAPRLVIKQMTSLAKFLDSESYTLRCAIIEVCGNLITMLSKQEPGDQNENHKAQLNAFFDVLEERFLDINPYCRSRAAQVFSKLCDLETKFPKRRQAATELACRSLEDKSSNVRRNAIKLIGKLISTHPFGVLHGGQLSLKEWQERLEAVDVELNALQPPAALAETAHDSHADSQLLDDATVIEEDEKVMDVGESNVASDAAAQQVLPSPKTPLEEATTSQAINKLQLTRRYYIEATKFISVLHEASPIICQLLLSKNKSEVIEAMDFFMVADAYKIEVAGQGIRKMLHLIWTKGNSDEGKGVQAHLIECYKGIYFDAPDSFSSNDAANYIARNMISLTFGATLAELTSLEQLLGTMVKADIISELVVSKLWQIYNVQNRNISRTQRRGAIMVLSMLAVADHQIVIREMESMLQIGLGKLGRADLALAKHTCIALARMKPIPKKNKNASIETAVRLRNDHAALVRLYDLVMLKTQDQEWYGAAEQAINAIYMLAKHPDVLCSSIIRTKTMEVFQQSQGIAGPEESMLLTPPPEEPMPASKSESATDLTSAGRLAQLLFVVGHVAIKQVVHLELCELDFKKRKAEQEKTKVKDTVANASPTKKKPAEDNELDLIGGTTEDDFTEAIAHIREREILFGQDSLLSNFCPLVSEICANNTYYPDQKLQATATICMAKLMCVSSEYCEDKLPLLITILEKSTDPITRSNVVIALGDMAVCFNNLIDENTDFLYGRLKDGDASVKRTCLMTLTFLILAGQIKVKGQLGEMAKCLEDSDRKIADLSRMFFTELATKDNAVYNQFIDMFSVLSTDQELGEESFKKILKFLSSFIEKDKHSKQLSQKLAARLRRCDDEKQWNDVAYALSLLQHKDEDIQNTLSEGFKVVQTATGEAAA